jgi:hypothetical protein
MTDILINIIPATILAGIAAYNIRRANRAETAFQVVGGRLYVAKESGDEWRNRAEKAEAALARVEAEIASTASTAMDANMKFLDEAREIARNLARVEAAVTRVEIARTAMKANQQRLDEARERATASDTPATVLNDDLAKRCYPTTLPDYVSDVRHEIVRPPLLTDDIVRYRFKIDGRDCSYGFGGVDLAKMLDLIDGADGYWNECFSKAKAKLDAEPKFVLGCGERK